MIINLIRRIFIDRKASRFTFPQKGLHWLVVLLCISQIPTSWAIERTHLDHFFHRDPDTYDLVVHQIHIWTGISIALIAVARLVLRYIHGAPPLPANTSFPARLASGWMHFSLYALLGLSPAAGFMAAYVDGRFGAIHSWLNWILLWLACLHVAAGLWHHFVRRDDVLVRMIRSGSAEE